MQGIPSVLPVELRVGTQHQKSRRGGVRWAPRGLAGEEGVASLEPAPHPLQACIILLHRGRWRPRALSEASPLAWAAPPSQSTVPSQLHIRLARGIRTKTCPSQRPRWQKGP